MATAHPNQSKMTAAVQRWVDDAYGRPDGQVHLARKAQWIADQIAVLGRADLDTPPHLQGLTVWDLTEAQSTLEAAARKARVAAWTPPRLRAEIITQAEWGLWEHRFGQDEWAGARAWNQFMHALQIMALEAVGV